MIRKRGTGDPTRFGLLAPERLTVPVLDTDGAALLAPKIATVSVSQLQNASAMATRRLDDVRIYDRRLRLGEIKELVLTSH